MTVQLLGVRGSTAAPGRPFVEIGGHTSCLAVHPEHEGDPWLVLDAGTGFRNLGPVLADRPLDADVVLTHLHWDHVQGLPFLPQADRVDARVTLWIPTPDGEDDAQALELLAGGYSPPHFPIRPDGVRGAWTFRSLVPQSYTMGGRTVRVGEVRHKGGRTMGVRVTAGGRSFAYLPDHGVGTASPRQLADADALVDGVDVLFHGAPYVAAERAMAEQFGHSTVQDAVDVAVRNRVGRLVLVHHAPHRVDSQAAQVLAEAEQRADELGVDLSIEIGRELAVVTV